MALQKDRGASLCTQTRVLWPSGPLLLARREMEGRLCTLQGSMKAFLATPNARTKETPLNEALSLSHLCTPGADSGRIRGSQRQQQWKQLKFVSDGHTPDTARPVFNLRCL